MSADLPAQRAAVARALLIDPTTPAVAWEAANLALADGNTDQALARFRTVVAYDPVLAPDALTLAWRTTADLPRILDLAIPSTSPAYAFLLDVLLEQRAYASLPAFFDALEQHRLALPQPRALLAADAALHSGQPDLALRIWRSIARNDPAFAAYLPTPANPIVNPGFESDLLNTAFDWTLIPVPGISAQSASGDDHSGDRSLRLDFAASSWSDAGLSQLVLVRPNARYTLSFWSKSENLLGISPPRLAVTDFARSSELARSEPLLSAGVWKQSVLTLHTPPDCRLLRISLFRDLPSALIRGRLSLDDFSLTEVR